MDNKILEKNRTYWNDHADLWFGTTSLPELGVYFPLETDLHLFGDVTGKRVLEICCGSGHSLQYLAERGAAELWGADLSQKQLENAEKLLAESGHTARLICGPMEELLPVPQGYFDLVYSIYGVGWSTDLPGTFRKIASYLKPGGTFIFSWAHPLNYCVGYSTDECRVVEEPDGSFRLTRSYFDENYFTMPVHDSTITFANHKISTYVNALADAGFVIERMVEANDQAAHDDAPHSPKARRALLTPNSMCFKARKG